MDDEVYPLNFVIVVEDGGELHSVSFSELPADVKHSLDAALNKILDDRAIASGQYDPADNNTPIVVE